MLLLQGKDVSLLPTTVTGEDRNTTNARCTVLLRYVHGEVVVELTNKTVAGFDSCQKCYLKMYSDLNFDYEKHE